MILLALHLHSLQVGIEFEGQMTLKGTEASAPDVPPDEGVRREPQKGRLPNVYMFIHLLELPIWFYIMYIPSYTFISCFRRTTGPAHRSSKGNWTAEEVKLALWSPKLAYYYAFLIK